MSPVFVWGFQAAIVLLPLAVLAGVVLLLLPARTSARHATATDKRVA